MHGLWQADCLTNNKIVIHISTLLPPTSLGVGGNQSIRESSYVLITVLTEIFEKGGNAIE